jgi:protein-disulfide isomerase
MRSRLRTPGCLLVVLAATAAAGEAQLANPSGFAPGERIEAPRLEAAGATGVRLGSLIGVRPVLVVYWRPGDALSERALLGAARVQSDVAAGVQLFPVGVLAAGQSPSRISQRLGELGLSKLPGHTDSGQLARLLGVRRVPTFALIDVTGVLRAVGGSDVGQESASGESLIGALAAAARGEPVPTLGVLPARPVYQLLGKRLTDVAATEPDGSTWRKLGEVIEPGTRTLVFYWSPTCPHCKEALPALRKWHDSGKPDDVRVVDIARADNPRLRREAAELIEGAPWRHLLDLNYGAGRKLLVTETPTSFLLDETGEVLSIQVGGDVDWGAWVGSEP